MASDLGERQGTILNAVVQEFIVSGEPVGSKHLVGRYRLAVSSATVRNDMSRLEELGYLTQPHTSAGRIPTDLGYRFFVDSVPRPVPLESRQERALEEALAPGPSDVEDLLHRASEVLSRFTHHAAAVLAPTMTEAKFRHIDLVRLSPQLALVVVVTGAGRVEKRVVEFREDVSQANLDAAQKTLNETLADARLTDGPRIANALASNAQAAQRVVMEEVAKAVGDVMQDESRVFVGGTANLAGAAFSELDTLHRIFEALEAQQTVGKLLGEGLQSDTSVRIGSELTDEDLRSCSIVMSSYTVGGTPLGTVGVIGPTRMDYTKAMAITYAVARTIREQLEQISG